MTMVEVENFALDHRMSLTTVIGTAAATILGPAPPNMMYEIVEVEAVGFGATVSGRLMQFATLQGYSQYGTILGTIVEPFSAAPGSAFIDGNGKAAIAYVNPGNLLYGVVDAGSVQVKVVYRAINARGW